MPSCRPLFIITVIVDILLECARLESAISQRVNEWNEPRVAFGALMLLAENWQSCPESVRLSARELFFLALKKINSAALSREAKLVSREPREPVGTTRRPVFLHSLFLIDAVVHVWSDGGNIQTRVLALAIAAVERGITDILHGIVEPLVIIVENCSSQREKIHSTIAAEIIYENFELLKGALNVDLRYSLMISAVTLGGFASEEEEPADVNWKQHAGEKGVELLYIVACDDCGLFLRLVQSKAIYRLVTHYAALMRAHSSLCAHARAQDFYFSYSGFC